MKNNLKGLAQNRRNDRDGAKEQEWIHIEFEIICISNSFPKLSISSADSSYPKIGQKFKITNYEYNYGIDYIRLPLFGLVHRSNFMKIEEYRNQKINDLLT